MKFKFPETVCALCLIPLFGLVSLTAYGEMKPWALRDHYTFAGDSIIFRVDPKNAEWNAVTSSGANLVDAAYTEIELADGRVARLAESNWITDGRDTFTDGFGEGTRFRSEFKPLDGVHVEYHVNRYSNHAFMTIMLIVRNTNSTPLGLKSIRLGVIEEGMIHPTGPNSIDSSNAARRGTHLVPTKTDHMSLVKMKLANSGGELGIGLLQSGFVDSSVHFEEGPGGWGGTVESVYNPPIMISPQKTAQSDALWVMTTGSGVTHVQEFHDWAEGFIMPRLAPKKYPTSWVTVPNESNSGELLDAAGSIRIKSVNHALVPGGWEYESGNMPLERLSEAIRRKRMVPGITVDPLVAPQSSRGFTIPGPDGRHWVDLRIPDARDYGVSNLRRFIKWKYEFFAIEESDVPDGILQEMNITRSVADLVAFELMEEAAGELPVVPSSQLVLGNDERGWSQVVESTRKNNQFQVLTGPTRLDVNGVDTLSPRVLSLMHEVEGPIEIVGVPSKSVAGQLEGMFTLNDIGNE